MSFRVDLLSTAHASVIDRHVGGELRFIEDVREFMKKRAKLDAEYAKGLGKLTATAQASLQGNAEFAVAGTGGLWGVWSDFLSGQQSLSQVGASC